MGLKNFIAKVLSFKHTETNGAIISDTTGDPGGGANITAQHFQPAGDDASPLPGDYAVFAAGQREGQAMAVGYVDPLSERVSGPGEKRIYARDASGAVVAQAHLKSSGDITIFNGAANFTLSAGGAVSITNGGGSWVMGAGGTHTINGLVTIDASGTLTAPKIIANDSLIIAGKEVKDHDHPAGDPPGNTGPGPQ